MWDKTEATASPLGWAERKGLFRAACLSAVVGRLSGGLRALTPCMVVSSSLSCHFVNIGKEGDGKGVLPTGDELCPTGWLSRQGGPEASSGRQENMDRLPEPDACCGATSWGLRMALLVSRGKWQLPVGSESCFRSPSKGVGQALHAGSPRSGKRQLTISINSRRLADWSLGLGVGSRGLISRAEGLPPEVWPPSTVPHDLLKNSTVDTHSRETRPSAGLGKDHKLGLLL